LVFIYELIVESLDSRYIAHYIIIFSMYAL